MKARYFVAIAFIALAYSTYSLIQAQRDPKSLQDTIATKDASGYDTTAEQAQLASYTASHMLTGRTIFLQGAYERAKTAAQQASASQANGNVYAQAQAACGGGHADSVTQAKCVTAYVSSHAQPAANPQPAVLPNQADYMKKFASPSWTASPAGIGLLIGVAALSVAAFLAMR